MAVIYMKHPFHGEKVACSEEEAAADEKRGWKRFEVKQPEAKLKDPEGWRNRMAAEEHASMVAWDAKKKAEKEALARKRNRVSG